MKMIFFIAFFISANVFAQNKAEIERIVTSKNYYEVLNVTPDASEQEIRKAYRKLLSTYHPDKYANNEKIFNAANRVMRSLNEARDVLIDPLKRKAFDITARATSSMKTASAKTASPTPKAKPSAESAWQKHQFVDFGKENAANSARPQEKAQAQQKPETSGKQKSETHAKTAAEAKPEPKKTGTGLANTSSSTSVGTNEKTPLSSKAKEALKMYGDNNKACGSKSFFQAIVDVTI
jgi:DnaJ-class molecular chaperone with C-terminal Zn finger domain